MIGVIIQARTGSSRFPRKIYEDINGKYTLQRVLEGVTRAQMPHKIILAMPEYDQKEFEQRLNAGEFQDFIDDRFKIFFGHPDNLIDRYYQAAKFYNIDLVVRVTADCPLIQGKIIDKMLAEYFKKGYNNNMDFLGNNETVSDIPFPSGTDVEIMGISMLKQALKLAETDHFREHCTPYIYRNGTQFNIHSYDNCKPNVTISMKYPDFSFDDDEDLNLIKALVEQHDKHSNLNKAIQDTNFTKLKSPKEL